MIRSLLIGAVTVSAALLTSIPPTAAVAVTPDAVGEVVEQYRAVAQVPGVAVAVTRGSEIVHVGGYGRTADGAQLTERSVLAVASLSKSITALAVLQLVERGLVDLDQPVQRYLPEFTTADPRTAQITVRHLLDQTSGLTDRSVAQFSRPQPESLRDSVADFRTAELTTDPGTRWAYYNPNYQIAARLVEVVGGVPFDRYLAGRVFGPLGMTDSRAGATERDLPPSAGGHVVVLGRPLPLPEPPAFGAGSGGVLSSARDLAAWLIMHNGGPTVVSPASLAAMHRPSSPASGRYGLGWAAGRTPSGAPLVSHGGDLFTSTAYQALLPDTGYGIAVLANTGTAGDATAIGERLVALVDGTPLPPHPDQRTALDAVLVGLGLAALAAGALGAVRARRWAVRHPRWRSLLVRLPLYVAPPLLVVAFAPVVGALYRGRDLTWLQAVYQFPSFVVLLGALSVATVATGCARLYRMARLSP